MKTIAELEKENRGCIIKMESILEVADSELTDEQQIEFDNMKALSDSLSKQIDNRKAFDKAKAEADRVVNVSTALDRQVLDIPSSVINDPANLLAADAPIKLPARAKRWAGNLKSFKGADADVRAYKAGMWLAATLCGSTYAKQFCKQHGITTNRVDFDTADGFQNIHQGNVNTTGGYLVFDEYETDIIRLVEAYGLARQKLKKVPMISDTKNRPRRTGGLTAYFVGEGAQITESTGSWDNVKLIAKKLAAISVASNELISDAIVSIADEITREIALAFATKEDLCCFQGDGTSTYGGIAGIVNRLSTINGVDDGGGLVLGANNTYAEVTDAELTKCIGQVPNYPGLRPEWYCSKPFWYQVMVRLIRATGGATMAEMEGITRMIYAGYPVNWTSGTTVMPVTVENSQISCLFGDLSMAGMFGDRAGMAIATSGVATVGDTSMFDTDSFAIRGIERFDINIHDVGDASNAGPVVGFIQAAS